MRGASISVLLAGIAVNGCTSVQLEQSTLGQGKTFTDLEYTMVLDNVAMFVQNKDSLPWQLQLTQGSISINDDVNPSFSYAWPAVTRTLGISASRTWQESWTVVPVINDRQLLGLQQAYQSVVTATNKWFEVGPPRPSCPCGHYGLTFVWVKPENVTDLTKFVLKVLDTTHETGKGSLMIPGPPQMIGR